MLIVDSESYVKPPKNLKFRNDCATIAHAIAFDKKYKDAKNDLDKLGLDNYWKKYATTFGVKDVIVFTESYIPENINYKKTPPLGKKITTLKSFSTYIKQDEVWIVGVRGHVLTIKEGVMYDRKGVAEGDNGWRRRVNVAYRIK